MALIDLEVLSLLMFFLGAISLILILIYIAISSEDEESSI